jgi:hypothetical protein
MPDEPLTTAAVAAVRPDLDPEVVELLTLFGFSHLPAHLQEISEPFAYLAADLVNKLSAGNQLKAGLYDLLRAKDCMVRQRLLDRRPAGS